ncbi:GNAT family N-acetyltransferase [Brevibacillus nitrificans]|nr:GNAT family N-acetyltransferase [Brevibacillus nitrificans]
MITIKMAAADEAHTITRLMHEAFRHTTPPSSSLLETAEQVHQQLASGNELAAIALQNDEPAGMVRFQLKGDDLYFFRLSVDPGQQGKGIGRMLLEGLEQYAVEHGIKALTCRVRMEIEKNVRMYTSAGFQITKREIVERAGTEGIPTAYMKKELT